MSPAHNFVVGQRRRLDQSVGIGLKSAFPFDLYMIVYVNIMMCPGVLQRLQ